MFEKERKSRYGMLAIIAVALTILYGALCGMFMLKLIKTGINKIPKVDNKVTDESAAFEETEMSAGFDATGVYEDIESAVIETESSTTTSTPEPAVVQETGNNAVDTMLAFYASEASFSYCDLSDRPFADDYDQNNFSEDPAEYEIMLYDDYLMNFGDDPVRALALEYVPAVVEIISYDDHVDYVFDLNPDYGLRVVKGKVLDGTYPAQPGYYIAQTDIYKPESDVNWGTVSNVGDFTGGSTFSDVASDELKKHILEEYEKDFDDPYFASEVYASNVLYTKSFQQIFEEEVTGDWNIDTEVFGSSEGWAYVNDWDYVAYMSDVGGNSVSLVFFDELGNVVTENVCATKTDSGFVQ